MPTPTGQNARPLSTLTADQVEKFLADGYVMIPQAFPREVAAQVTPLAWEASPFRRDDRKTWDRELHVVAKNISGGPISQLYSPRVVGVMDDLLGAGRYGIPSGTGYVVWNMPGFATPPWKMFGGHVDGNFFHHHVDSREQGLVLLFLFSDLKQGGGGTGIRVGSHRTTARVLADAEPAGLSCGDLCRLADEASRGLPVIEAIGDVGDMLVMHPFTFHGSSSNLRDEPRIASNMCVGLKEKMNLRRENPSDYSPVEEAIVAALAG